MKSKESLLTHFRSNPGSDWQANIDFWLGKLYLLQAERSDNVDESKRLKELGNEKLLRSAED